MKDSTINTLLIIIILMITVLIYTGIYYGLEGRDEEREKVCKSIGEKKGLEYYKHTSVDCGWREDCVFQCKFLNDEGDIVTKNVK